MVKKNNSITDLSIIVLNYNTEFWLKKTLSTLQEYFLQKTQYSVEVIVVDNASQDGSVAMVKKEFPWVVLMPQTENKGYAVGNNVAIRKANGRYIMLLNSDMECTQQTSLDILIEYLDSNEKVGVITPRVELLNGSLDPASHRGEPTPWAAFTYFSGLAKLFPKISLFSQYQLTHLDFDTVHEIDACSGAAMIVRRSVINKVGLLDEQFFMYAEDLDWCKRIRESGYKIIFNPKVTIIHHKYKSGMKSLNSAIRQKTTAHFYDTMLQYYDKHYKSHYPDFVRWGLVTVTALKKGVS